MSIRTKQASQLAAAAHTAEVSELKRRLERADEELIHTKKQLAEKQGMRFTSNMIQLVVCTILLSFVVMLTIDASEVETLKNTLVEAQKEAEGERAARQKHESWVEEVQQVLKDAIGKNVSPQSARFKKTTKYFQFFFLISDHYGLISGQYA